MLIVYADWPGRAPVAAEHFDVVLSTNRQCSVRVEDTRYWGGYTCRSTVAHGMLLTRTRKVA
jgi:hypothetical protein